MALDKAWPREAPGDRTVGVGLDGRGYDIVIGAGLLKRMPALIAAAAPGTRCAVVTDETVAGLHLPTVESVLSASDALIGSVVVPAGEASKRFAVLETVSEKLLGLGVERGDSIVALGGGVVGDLAGFAAAILRRGVRLIQAPTTLLAQVDSSVGGKTGINSPQGKNLIGAFHQPALVIADIELLDTLAPRQFRAGYAEVAKYGLLGDAALFAWLTENAQAMLSGDAATRAYAVEACCRAKARLVEADEREWGERALLNLGHTFGHALEAFAGYSDRLLHGEAVAVGMALAFELSHELGLCPRPERDAAIAHLRSVGLPTRIGDVPGPRPDAATLLGLMAQDKKVRAGKPTFILTRGIGKAFVERDPPMDTIAAFLTRQCEVR